MGLDAHASFHDPVIFNQLGVVGAARAQCTKNSPYIVNSMPLIIVYNYVLKNMHDFPKKVLFCFAELFYVRTGFEVGKFTKVD